MPDVKRESMTRWTLNMAYPNIVEAVDLLKADGVSENNATAVIVMAFPWLLFSRVGDLVSYYIEEVYRENRSGDQVPGTPAADSDVHCGTSEH